jgi:NAD(P)-dependent dehydrogenase (short-subunit alcohol dehydrogenase family)
LKGIGLALTNDLAQKGWKLAIVDMNTTQGEAVVAKLGEGNAVFIKADVSKWEENVRFFKMTKERFGRIDFGMAPLASQTANIVLSCGECRN